MEFNETKDSVAERTKTKNLAGSEAFEPDSPEMALYKVTINNLLEDTYYREDIEELRDLKKKFEACADDNPEFVLKLAAFARDEMGLRDVPQVLLVMASKYEKTKEYVRDYADQIMVRADEPCTVVAIHNEFYGETTSISKPLRKGIEDALHNFDLYQFDKYDNRNRMVNIRDVINRVHPAPRDDLRDEAFERLMKGDNDSYPEVEPLNESQGATWETVLTEKGNNAEAWREALGRMGIMAKLRNVRNMKESGLRSKEIFGDYDLESVRKSRMFPFRVYQSYKAAKDANVGDLDLDKWMSSAIDTSTENLPDRLENTLSVADISGSMNNPVSEKSNLTMREIATLFTASVGRKGADTAAFARNFMRVDAHGMTPTLELREKIERAEVGGTTNGWKVFKQLRQEDKKYDRIVMFTDMQLWDSRSYRKNTSFQEQWRRYKEEIAPDAKLYLIDLSSYGDLVTPEGAEDVYNISGWTEKVIDFIEYAEDEDEIIREIEDYAPE